MRLVLVFAFLFLSTRANALHVIVDPGHGGVDAGAVKGKIEEAAIALKVSLKLAELLRKDSRFQVSMTRDSDTTVALNRRTEIAKEKNADLFLSVHLNSSTDARAHGQEFYFQNQIPADEEALFLASKENAELGIVDHVTKKTTKVSPEGDVKLIVEDLKRNHRVRQSGTLSKNLYMAMAEAGRAAHLGTRAIRQAPFHVVANATMPSVLVEIGFLSHANEGPLLTTAEHQNAIAKSLYQGLVKYKESVDKTRTAP